MEFLDEITWPCDFYNVTYNRDCFSFNTIYFYFFQIRLIRLNVEKIYEYLSDTSKELTSNFYTFIKHTLRFKNT